MSNYINRVMAAIYNGEESNPIRKLPVGNADGGLSAAIEQLLLNR